MNGDGTTSFGALLQRYRGFRGLTQEQLAERSGLSAQEISLLERDVRRWPRSTTVESLVKGLDLDAVQREALVAAARRRSPAAGARLPSVPIPRELPRPPADFTGRASELATLLHLLDTGDQPVICTIDGMGGIGKSALAIHAAHHVAGAFPDGQLYVDLQGADAALPPLEPASVLGRMLRSLGLEPNAGPATVDEASARFRSLAAARRLLLLLDNASGAEQVRPLLPGSPTCAVVVTSRQPLATLEGATALHLDGLGDEDALELLGRIVGGARVRDEVAAGLDVVQACARLPLAIRIAGARLAARPGWSVGELAGHLTDAASRLDTLRSSEFAVRTSFDVSLRTLEESQEPGDREAAAAFALLGLPDGPDIEVAAAARLLDRAETTSRDLLERLVDAQLLNSPGAGRYRFHDLVRLYAREHAGRALPECEGHAALLRLIGFYDATARGSTGDPGRPDGMRWLEIERANMVAAIAQAGRFGAADGSPVMDALACSLARTLSDFFAARACWEDLALANEAALAIARRRGDLAVQAAASRELGRAYDRLGRLPESLACREAGVAISRDIGDRAGEADGLIALSSSYGRLGRYEEAIDRLRRSLAIARELGDRALQANSLGNLGCVHECLGNHERAVAVQRESLAVFHELGQREGQARALNNLARALVRTDRIDEAIACAGQCVAICRELGHREGEAESLNTLGTLHGRLRRHEQAIAYQRESLAIFRDLNLPRGELTTLRDLGDALLAAGRRQEARAAWREGIAISELTPLPQTEEVRARLESAAADRPRGRG